MRSPVNLIGSRLDDVVTCFFPPPRMHCRPCRTTETRRSKTRSESSRSTRRKWRLSVLPRCAYPLPLVPSSAPWTQWLTKKVGRVPRLGQHLFANHRILTDVASQPLQGIADHTTGLLIRNSPPRNSTSYFR